MDNLTIYRTFYDQIYEALDWMLQEENGRVVSAYIDAAATFARRLVEAGKEVKA